MGQTGLTARFLVPGLGGVAVGAIAEGGLGAFSTGTNHHRLPDGQCQFCRTRTLVPSRLIAYWGFGGFPAVTDTVSPLWKFNDDRVWGMHGITSSLSDDWRGQQGFFCLAGLSGVTGDGNA